jgi:hypothetical protein
MLRYVSQKGILPVMIPDLEMPALKEILEQNFKKKEAVRDYEVPNWELRQVAVNEYNQVLKDVLDIITISKE